MTDRARDELTLAFDPSLDRHEPGESKILGVARSLNQLLFEAHGGIPVVQEEGADRSDPPLVQAARLVRTLARLQEDVGPLASLAMAQLLALSRGLLRQEVRKRAILENGINESLKRAAQVVIHE